jgi:hypothetical protein
MRRCDAAGRPASFFEGVGGEKALAGRLDSHNFYEKSLQRNWLENRNSCFFDKNMSY